MVLDSGYELLSPLNDELDLALTSRPGDCTLVVLECTQMHNVQNYPNPSSVVPRHFSKVWCGLGHMAAVLITGGWYNVYEYELGYASYSYVIQVIMYILSIKVICGLITCYLPRSDIGSRATVSYSNIPYFVSCIKYLRRWTSGIEDRI